MKKTKKNLLKAIVCLATLSPVMMGCVNDKKEETQQTHYEVNKATPEHGTFSLVVDPATNKILVVATPDAGYKFSRAYYVLDNDDPDLEYNIPETGFERPKDDITVFVEFVVDTSGSNPGNTPGGDTGNTPGGDTGNTPGDDQGGSGSQNPSVSNADINVATIDNVTLSVDNENAKAGDTVNVTVTPATGYRVKRLFYVKSDTTEVEITNNTFTMIDAAITVKAEVVKYYGTYRIKSVSGVDSEMAEEIIESTNDALSFISIGEKVSFSSISIIGNHASFDTTEFDYTIQDDVISYEDSMSQTVSLTLGDGVFSVPLSVGVTCVYELVEEVELIDGRYVDSDSLEEEDKLEYIFDDGKLTGVMSDNNTGVVYSTVEMGDVSIFGNILVVQGEGELTVLEIKQTASGYSIEGLYIDQTISGLMDVNYSEIDSDLIGADVVYTTEVVSGDHGNINWLDYDETSNKVVVHVTPEEGYIVDTMYYVEVGDLNNTKHYFDELGFVRPTNKSIKVYVTFKNAQVAVSVDSNLENGSVEVGTTGMIVLGDTVSVTVTPEKGYRVEKVYYINGDNEEVEIENGQFIANQQAITIKAEFTKYYGTYVLVDVKGADSTTAEKMIQDFANGLGRFTITEDKFTLAIVNLDGDTAEYSVSEMDYTIDGDNISTSVAPVILHSNGFSITDNGVTSVFELVEDIVFDEGIFVSEGDEGSDYYEYSFDGNRMNAKYIDLNTGLLQTSSMDFEIYGNYLVSDKNGFLNILQVLKTDTGYEFNGLNIEKDHDNEWGVSYAKLIKIETPIEVNVTTMNVGENGEAYLDFNFSTEMIEVEVFPDRGYIVNEMYYIVEGSNEKVVIENNTFVRPYNVNFTVYVTFVTYYGSYAIESIVIDGTTYTAEDLGLEHEFMYIDENQIYASHLTSSGESSDFYFSGLGVLGNSYYISDGCLVPYGSEGEEGLVNLLPNVIQFQADGLLTLRRKENFNFEPGTYRLIEESDTETLFILDEMGSVTQKELDVETGEVTFEEVIGNYTLYGAYLLVNITTPGHEEIFLGELRDDDSSMVFDGRNLDISQEDTTVTNLYSFTWNLEKVD